MASKKHNISNTPRRKRYSRKDQVKNSLEERQKQKGNRKREKEQKENLGDGMFYFVAGYTENGVPYGLTKEEMVEVDEKRDTFRIDNDDLPF